MKKMLICEGVINEDQSRAEDSDRYLNAPHNKGCGGGEGLSEGARPHTKTGTGGVVL